MVKYEKRDTCRDCGVLLNAENQYASCKKRGQYCCKKCWNQRFYFAVRKGKYGLSLPKIEKILESQGNKCAICETALSRFRMAVDHCHESGRVRGLLCSNCNSGIGMLKDSADIVYRALDYLRGRALLDLRDVDFGEDPVRPPLKMDAANIKRRAYVEKNRANIRRIDKESRDRISARKKAGNAGNNPAPQV